MGRIRDAVVAERARAWWQPSSFRDLIAAVLTAILAVGVGFVVWSVLERVGAPPTAYTIGTNTQSFDSFERSQDILTVVLPLFTAAFSFWFGVTVEGQRADAAQEQATMARERRKRSSEFRLSWTRLNRRLFRTRGKLSPTSSADSAEGG